MKLTKIDLSRIVAAGHNGVQLGLLIDRGEEIEYIEIPRRKLLVTDCNMYLILPTTESLEKPIETQLTRGVLYP